MYLAREIRTIDGERHPMAGLIEGDVAVRDKLQALGYVEVETQAPTVLGPAGLRFRGHQFRYSELISPPPNCDRRYSVRRRRGGEVQAEGYATGPVLASYVHAHWASSPEAAHGFVHACAAFGAQNR
jgi:cobyrinic acid a,c-diamide synthase